MTHEITQYETTPYETIPITNWTEGWCLVYKKNLDKLTEQSDTKFRDSNIYSTIDSIVEDNINSNTEKNKKSLSKFKKGLNQIMNKAEIIVKGGIAGTIVGAGIGYMNGNIQEGAILGAEYGLILGVSKQFVLRGIYHGIIKPGYKKFKKYMQKKHPNDIKFNAYEGLIQEIIKPNPRLIAEAIVIAQIIRYDNHETMKRKAFNVVMGGALYTASALPYNLLSDENIKLKIAFSIGAVETIIDKTHKYIKQSISDNRPNNKKIRETISTLDKEERFQLIGGLIKHWHGQPSYEVDFRPARQYV